MDAAELVPYQERLTFVQAVAVAAAQEWIIGTPRVTYHHYYRSSNDSKPYKTTWQSITFGLQMKTPEHVLKALRTAGFRVEPILRSRWMVIVTPTNQAGETHVDKATD